MGETTGIEWCHFTASPWYGCTRVDPCCVHCYAADLTIMRFAGGKGTFIREAYRKAGFADWETRPAWGDSATRVLARDFEGKLRRWNKKAQELPYRPRLFTSLMDWLDDMPGGIITLDGVHEGRVSVVGFYLRSVFEAQNIDHLLLTKRPENWRPRVEEIIRHFGVNSGNDSFCAWLQNWLDGEPPANVWFGYTAGTKDKWIDRHSLSWEIPARVTWCSCEPMLDELWFTDLLRDAESPASHNLDWLVVGLESGRNRRSRPIEPLVNLARAAKTCGCRVFVKQDEGLYPGGQGRIPAEVWALKEMPEIR